MKLIWLFNVGLIFILDVVIIYKFYVKHYGALGRWGSWAFDIPVSMQYSIKSANVSFGLQNYLNF